MNKELSGAAGDVLHALFFRGALVDGDLPSKAGAVATAAKLVTILPSASTMPAAQAIVV